MSDLHRYGFAYGHPRVPLPHGKDDDPARAQFLDHLAALRRQGQRYIPTPSQSHNDATTRNESYAGSFAVWATPLFCKVCGKALPVNRRSVCSKECSAEANRIRQEKWHHRALKAAIAAGEPIRPCKVCGGPIPLVENGRKVRTDCWTCSPACRRKDAQRARDRRRSAKRAAARAAKAVAK